MARVSTGFHRIGVVLSAPGLAIGLWHGAQEWRYPSGEIISPGLDCEPDGAEQDPRCKSFYGADGQLLLPSERTEAADEAAIGPTREPNLAFAILVFAIGGMIYIAIRTLGWIVAAFTGEPR